MYTTEIFETTISVEEYLQDYVDVETFLNACKQCPNYDCVWSCPSYHFDVLDYWRKYQILQLTAVKINFDKNMLIRTYTQEELDQILKHSISLEKQKLSEMLFKREEKYPGSISLSAGSCSYCLNGCTRTSGQPCRYPDKLRYSIESLGGNVGLAIERLMKLRLEWIEEGHLPPHFVLVCGLLIP